MTPRMAPKATALVVEDDDGIRRFLRLSLEAEGMKVVEAGDAATALATAQRFRPELFLVDLGLPDVEGVELITRLRESSRNPIIVLSAKTHEAAKVHALDAGADDYLTKPFGIHELKARVRVALRHQVTLRDPEVNLVVRMADVVLDLAHRRVTKGGQVVHLTPTEFKLLTTLARHPGKVITHRSLLVEVWGKAYERETHYLRVYMKQLREKLETDPSNPRHLVTELGVGYRLVLDGEALVPTPANAATGASFETGPQG